MSPVAKAPAAKSPKVSKPKAVKAEAEPKKVKAPKAKAETAEPKPAAKEAAAPKAAAKPAAKKAAAPKAVEAEKAPAKRKPKKSAVELSLEALQSLIVGKLDDDKAEELVVIDLKGKSPLADAIVVASGRSQRHVAAMADHLVRTLKENGAGKARVEGLPQADWVLIDAGDIIVHLFRPEVRAFYQIEKIWSVDSKHLVSTT
jgi:ribosome-associated protein